MTRLRSLLRDIWDTFATDDVTGERSMIGFVVSILFLAGMLIVTLAMWAFGILIAFLVVREAVRFCLEHPVDGEAIGLYFLGGGVVAMAAPFGVLALDEMCSRGFGKRASNGPLVIGGVGLAA